MHHEYFRYLFAAAALYAVPLLAASIDVANPAAPVPALNYHSAMSDYRAYSDENVREWRAVNDEVARIGGHIGIVGGAAGHGMHTDKKGPAQPVGPTTPAPGQPPVRSAPQAPAGGAHQH
jgi:hypothetical protein